MIGGGGGGQHGLDQSILAILSERNLTKQHQQKAGPLTSTL